MSRRAACPAHRGDVRAQDRPWTTERERRRLAGDSRNFPTIVPLRFFELLFALALALGATGAADAAISVRVVDTWPSGDRVVLGRNQQFHLRIAYASDEPAGIWVSPYFRGKPARAGTSPSPRHSGSGETSAWFFLMEPEAEVDEIRITAGNGGSKTTPVVATHRVHVVLGGDASAAGTPPTWVTQLGEQSRAAAREQARAAADAPMSAVESVLFIGTMVAMPIVPLLGFVAPIWMYRRWRGGWRIAAAVPGIMMAFVVLRIVVGVAIDSTSHNLWPFETLIAGAASVGAIVLLALLHRLSGAGRHA